MKRGNVRSIKSAKVEAPPTKQELALMLLAISQGFETVEEMIDTETDNDHQINLEACAMLLKNYNEDQLKELLLQKIKK